MASTSSGNKENNLEEAKEAVEGSLSYPVLEANISVRRRRRATKFLAEDLLFVVEFQQSEQGGNLPLLSVLVTVYKAVLELIKRLKTYFDDKKKRYSFFSCSVDGMTSSVYTGALELHKEKNSDLAGAVLRPLFLYLCSKTAHIIIRL